MSGWRRRRGRHGRRGEFEAVWWFALSRTRAASLDRIALGALSPFGTTSMDVDDMPLPTGRRSEIRMTLADRSSLRFQVRPRHNVRLFVDAFTRTFDDVELRVLAALQDGQQHELDRLRAVLGGRHAALDRKLRSWVQEDMVTVGGAGASGTPSWIRITREGRHELADRLAGVVAGSRAVTVPPKPHPY